MEVQPASRGPTEMKHIKHVKYVLLADKYTQHLSDYSAFRRKTTLQMNPDHIPDLHWNLTSTYHTTGIGHVDTQSIDVTTHYINVITLSHAKGNRCGAWCGTTLNTNTSTSQSNQKTPKCSIKFKT